MKNINIIKNVKETDLSLHIINRDDANFLLASQKTRLENSKRVFNSLLRKNMNSRVIIKNDKCESKQIEPSYLIKLEDPTLVHSNINKDDYILFYPCNTSITKYNDDYIVNVRFVNYWLTMDNENNEIYYTGKFKDEEKVFITTNKYIKLNSNFEVLESKFMDVDFKEIKDRIKLRKYHSNEGSDIVMGLEDVRLFKYGEYSIKYLGSKKITKNELLVVSGDYNYNDFNDCFILNRNNLKNINDSKKQMTICEKNWTFVEVNGELNVVYKWYPIQLCKIDDSKSLILNKEIHPPPFFEKMRGSTCGCSFQNKIWFVTHFVNWEVDPNKKYYHVFVIFDTDFNLLKYSQPFTFESLKIEFCIGLVIEEHRLILTYSTNDSSSKLAVYDREKLINSLKWKILKQ